MLRLLVGVLFLGHASHKFFGSAHPVLGFAANPGNPQNPFPGNAGLQSVLAPAKVAKCTAPTTLSRSAQLAREVTQAR